MARCLVVDDSDVIRLVLSRILDRLGHETIETKDVCQAIDHAMAGEVDVVFLDWDMPNLAALDFLKGVAKAENLDIVLCATENDPQQFALARSAGARHHILKPYDAMSIRAIMAHVAPQPASETRTEDEAAPPVVRRA